ncbi:MAG: hypothetical protein AAGA64_02260 [Bacteroidota bacterium]
MENQYDNDKLKHDIATITAGDGVDEAANRGVIGSGEQVAKLTDMDIDPETGRKKKKIEDELIKIATLDAWKSAMDDLANEIGGKIDELGESLKVEERLKKAKADGDITELKVILAEQGIDVSGMNNAKVLDATDKELDLQDLKQETLIQEIKDLAEDYKQGLQNEDISPEAKQEYVHKLAALRLKAEGVEGLDYNEAFEDCFKLDVENEFFELGVLSNTNSSYDTHKVSKGLTQSFNENAPTYNNDQSLDHNVVIDEPMVSIDPSLGGGLAF